MAAENNQELKEPLEHIKAQINIILGDLWKSPASILTGFSTTMNTSCHKSEFVYFDRTRSK